MCGMCVRTLKPMPGAVASTLATGGLGERSFLRPYSAQVLRFFKDELSAKVPELHRTVWDN